MENLLPHFDSLDAFCSCEHQPHDQFLLDCLVRVAAGLPGAAAGCCTLAGDCERGYDYDGYCGGADGD